MVNNCIAHVIKLQNIFYSYGLTGPYNRCIVILTSLTQNKFWEPVHDDVPM